MHLKMLRVHANVKMSTIIAVDVAVAAVSTKLYCIYINTHTHTLTHKHTHMQVTCINEILVNLSEFYERRLCGIFQQLFLLKAKQKTFISLFSYFY